MNAMLRIEDESRNEVTEFFEDADQHQRTESHRIRSNHEKHKLPGERDSRESIVEKWMRDGRRILLADLVKDEIERGDDENSPNTSNIEQVFREFHAAPRCSIERNGCKS